MNLLSIFEMQFTCCSGFPDGTRGMAAKNKDRRKEKTKLISPGNRQVCNSFQLKLEGEENEEFHNTLQHIRSSYQLYSL